MSGYLSAPLWQHIAVLWIYCNSFKRSFKYEDNCQAWAFQSLLSAKHIKTYINGTSEIEFRSVIRTSSVQYCYPLMLNSWLEAITILQSGTSPPGALSLESGNKVPLQNFFFPKKKKNGIQKVPATPSQGFQDHILQHYFQVCYIKPPLIHTNKEVFRVQKPGKY